MHCVHILVSGTHLREKSDISAPILALKSPDKIGQAKTPLFVRPLVNFFIRYILKAGFLDGKRGFIWHFMQGYWYRMLVDCKIFELKMKLGYDDERIKEYLIKNYR